MIRLQRTGRKNIPNFRVVLTESKNSTKSGKFMEILGNFDMVNDKKTIDAERIKHWLSKGVQVSDTMHNFLLDQKIISGKKINNLPKGTPVKKEAKEEKTASAPVAAPVAEAVKAEPTAKKAEEPAKAEVPKA
ncbi:MAG: 30S ribosomal protein S16 [Candidatus Paceibacterota bacterium]